MDSQTDHTGGFRPFSCSECDFTAIDKFSIEHHERAKHKFVCPKCDFTGNSKQDLDKHTKEKHGTFADMIKKPVPPMPNKKPNASPPITNIGNDKNNYRKKHLNRGSNKNSPISVGPRLHMAKVFATNFSTDTTEAEVKAWLDKMLQSRTGKIHWVKVTKLETYFNTCNAFLITCKIADSSVFMDGNIWPDGVVFRWFQPSRLSNSPYNGPRTKNH